MADDVDYEALLEAPLRQEEKQEEKHSEQNGAGQEAPSTTQESPQALTDDKKRCGTLR